MAERFRTLALLGKINHDDVNQTLTSLYQFLKANQYEVLLEERLSRQITCA